MEKIRNFYAKPNLSLLSPGRHGHRHQTRLGLQFRPRGLLQKSKADSHPFAGTNPTRHGPAWLHPTMRDLKSQWSERSDPGFQGNNVKGGKKKG